MKWTRHYTGLEWAQEKRLGITLYASREGKNRMWRLSIPFHMVGLFWGRTNYLKGKGWELFTGNYRIGWSKEYGRYKFFRVQWSGSMNEPWSAFTWRVGRFGIGGRTPKWMLRIKERRENAKWAAMEGPEEGEPTEECTRCGIMIRPEGGHMCGSCGRDI
jgi:hypothetical protein